MISNKSIVQIELGFENTLSLGKLLSFEFDNSQSKERIKVTVSPFDTVFVKDELAQIVQRLGEMVTLKIIKGVTDEHRIVKLRAIEASTSERNGLYIYDQLALFFIAV